MQDVVISLTLIFSDALDVGDMVEIAGTVVVVGYVEEIGLRFTSRPRTQEQLDCMNALQQQAMRRDC